MMRTYKLLLIVCIVVLALGTGIEARSWRGSLPASEFPPGLDWLNTEQPIRLGDLQGKIVLLDFWTYGCINCLHNIPDLKQLAVEYADELVIIGVHSAKFPHEGITENIYQTLLRYGIDYPVVNDNDYQVWMQWAIRAWPTLILVDPAGNIVGAHMGEEAYRVLQPVIQSLVDEFAKEGTLNTNPVLSGTQQ